MAKLFLITAGLILIAVSLNVMSCVHSKKEQALLALPILKLEPLQELNLPQPLEKDRGAFISAASAIVKVKDQLYVVSDDEQFLFSFNTTDRILKPHRLLPGDLPADKTRKDEKADFESLVHLSAKEWEPYGALVAWPSGSGVKRMRAVVVPFEKNGELGKPQVSDILPLAYRLQPKAKDLNMEGLLVRDKKVFIFQRGNGGKGKNGMIEMSLVNWVKGLKKGDWSGKLEFKSIKIGTLSGVNLAFSDVTWTDHGLLALASAEDTVSAYGDGTIYGSVLVRLVGETAEILAKFDPIAKLEGIAAIDTSNGLELYVVDDADSAAAASRLYRVQVPLDLVNSVKQKK